MRAIKTYDAADIFMCSVIISCFETFRTSGRRRGRSRLCIRRNKAHVDCLADVFQISSVTKTSFRSNVNTYIHVQGTSERATLRSRSTRFDKRQYDRTRLCSAGINHKPYREMINEWKLRAKKKKSIVQKTHCPVIRFKIRRH